MTLERFRPHGPGGIKALAVCPRYSNAKSPARGPEDGVRGVLLAACVSTSLVVEPSYPLYLRGQLLCQGAPRGKEVGPAALLSVKLEQVGAKGLVTKRGPERGPAGVAGYRRRDVAHGVEEKCALRSVTEANPSVTDTQVGLVLRERGVALAGPCRCGAVSVRAVCLPPRLAECLFDSAGEAPRL